MPEANRVILGNDPEFRRVLNAARVVAATDVTVLILGESGTGKELIARDIHTHSRRAGRLFKVLNCAGADDGLFQTELEKLTRSVPVDAGRPDFRPEPSGLAGTLFLDEIGELSDEAQSNLLRFLTLSLAGQGNDVSRAGLHPRLIAATRCELAAEVDAGRFREDLYYRLHVVPLEMPALRNRAGDIQDLIKYYLTVLARYYRVPAPKFTGAATRMLKKYRWPGNIRELRNFCERMVILFSGKTVNPENLPEDIRRRQHVSRKPGLFTLPESGVSLPALEADMIKQALSLSSGNKSRAARLLGISRDTLLYRMQKHAIQF